MEYYLITLTAILLSILISNCLVFIHEEDGSVSTFLSISLTDKRWFITSLLVIGTTALSLYDMPIIVLVTGLLLAVNAVFDLKYLLGPDLINALIVITGIGYNLVTFGHLSSLQGGLISCIIIFIVWVIIHYTTNGGVGGGDFKLLMALSFMMGSSNLFLMVLFAIFIALFTLPYGLMKGKKLNEISIPLIPFFWIGYILTYRFGEQLINWYMGG